MISQTILSTHQASERFVGATTTRSENSQTNSFSAGQCEKIRGRAGGRDKIDVTVASCMLARHWEYMGGSGRVTVAKFGFDAPNRANPRNHAGFHPADELGMLVDLSKVEASCDGSLLVRGTSDRLAPVDRSTELRNNRVVKAPASRDDLDG